ncbi:MAG TPA: cyclic nucleotide-binding domain-containing protein, partial [Anaerolineae bacterium]
QDDEPDMIYFIESGQVTVQMEAPGQAPVRLETMRGGRMVGELGFYLGVRRTAAVVADVPSVVYALSVHEVAQIEKTDPEAANIFHRINIQLLSERAVHMVRMLNALER